jgi:hypothetical protein
MNPIVRRRCQREIGADVRTDVDLLGWVVVVDINHRVSDDAHSVRIVDGVIFPSSEQQ